MRRWRASKRKPVPSSRRKPLQVIEQRLFEFALGVFGPLGQAGEFEDVGIADEVGDGLLRGLLTSGAFEDGGFVFGQAGALVKEGADLALELADRPVALEALVFVEGAFERDRRGGATR